MQYPPSEGGKQLRALAFEVSARGLTRSDIRRAWAIMHIAFAGEEDEAALKKRIEQIALDMPEDTPSSFVAACDKFADVVDEVAARWEQDFT
jgi:hypothetical protein